MLVAATSVLPAQQPDLVVAKSLMLAAESDGFDRRLELLEDARLTPDLKQTLWGSGGTDLALDLNDPRYKGFASNPLRKAVVRVENASQRIVFEKALERELARIHVELLHTGRRTILITTDLSIGMGSYAGPLTKLFQVMEGRLEEVSALNAQSGRIEPIGLMRSLKTEWKTAPPSSAQMDRKDILLFACRPKDFGADDTKFTKIFTRYHWNGKEWVSYQRMAPGIWEDDDPFPRACSFPAQQQRGLSSLQTLEVGLRGGWPTEPGGAR